MSLFDSAAKNYDAWYQTKMGSFVDRVETECVLKLCDLPKGSKILDLGCGSGNFSIKLAKLGYEVVGIDLSREMLSLASEKAQNEGLSIEFHEMNVYDIEFDDESFDGVISVAAIEFIPKIQKAMDELMRVVKKGHPIIIGTIHKDSSWGRMYESDEMKKNSVFKYAILRTMKEMQKYYPDSLVDTDECLFLPPMTKEDEITRENDLKLKSSGEKGGFICLKWIK